VGAILGLLQNSGIDNTANFIAAIYVRLFQLLAVPTIVLAVTTTLATLGSGPDAGRIFRHTIMYTLLTTFVAALVGLFLYVIIAPGNMVISAAETGSQLSADTPQLSYTDHLLSVIPNNIVKPFLDGNVLSLLLLAAAVGIALSQMTDTPHKKSVVNFLLGIQEVLFMLIRGLIWTLPIGILAFAAQLSSQLSAGVIADSLGKYVAVVLGGNLLQFFVVLPVFLLLRGLNPIRVMTKMTPAIMMALFTKSSAATLPVTMQTAEERLGVKSQISRFVLPICTTINMNGCAAFILVTSLFVMQQGGIELTWTTMLTWVLISVVSAIGNAGVPMGCYFLTLSLMSGINAPIAVLGIILPIYTIIDMVETAVNVWSDSCVCAMTDHDLTDRT
jgi:Na+/H+-dicarboxylate symporter